MGTTATKSLNKKSIASYLGEYGAFIALVLLVVVISVISPEFRTAGNFLNLLRQATFNGLIAFGMTCVILSDGIDLSVGSTLALSAVICAKLIMQGVPAVLAMLIALVSGTFLGVVSGLLVTKGRLQPFIATLITMTAYRGLAMILTDGKPISNIAKTIEAEGGSAFPFKLIGKGNFCSVPIPAILLIFALIVFYFVLNKTTFGRKIYATGSNAKCAKLVGVNITWTKIIVYAISGFMSALTGLILIFGKQLMGIFTETTSLVELSRDMMGIIAVGYIAMAVTQSLSGVMRGAGDTMTPMWISLFTTVVVRVPIAYSIAYLTRTPELPNGRQECVYVSLLCAWLLGALATTIVYMKGNWKKKALGTFSTEEQTQAEC